MSSGLGLIRDWAERAHQSQYCVAKLAATLRIHPRTLERFFRANLGTYPQCWLHEARMLRARALLQVPGTRIKEVAAELGYSRPHHFARHFKSAFGVAPSAYQIGDSPSSPKLRAFGPRPANAPPPQQFA